MQTWDVAHANVIATLKPDVAILPLTRAAPGYKVYVGDGGSQLPWASVVLEVPGLNVTAEWSEQMHPMAERENPSQDGDPHQSLEEDEQEQETMLAVGVERGVW